jgi:hypothetical protein
MRVYAGTMKTKNDLPCPSRKFAVQFSSVDSEFDLVGVRTEAIVELKVVGE